MKKQQEKNNTYYKIDDIKRQYINNIFNSFLKYTKYFNFKKNVINLIKTRLVTLKKTEFRVS